MSSLLPCQEYGAEGLPADPPAGHERRGGRGKPEGHEPSLWCQVSGKDDVGHAATMRPNDHSVPVERGDEVGALHVNHSARTSGGA